MGAPDSGAPKKTTDPKFLTYTEIDSTGKEEKKCQTILKSRRSHLIIWCACCKKAKPGGSVNASKISITGFWIVASHWKNIAACAQRSARSTTSFPGWVPSR